MGKALTECEIAERIEQDDGDPEDEVLLKRSTSGTRYSYHDADDPCWDADAANYRHGPEHLTRAEAQARSIAPCKNCVISRDLSETHDFSVQMRAKRFDPERHDSLADVDLEGDA